MGETTTRQPGGIPVGGQFAATTHFVPDVTLHLFKAQILRLTQLTLTKAES